MALKIGTEERKKVAIAAALALVVLLLAAHTIFGGPDAPAPAPARAVSLAGPTASTPAPKARVTASAGENENGGAKPLSGAAQLDPTLHPELMAENEAYLYSSNGRNIFSLNSAPAAAALPIERVKAPVRPTVQAAYVPQGPPPPPAIDLRFFGFSARRDGSRKAFLLHGEDVFIAAEGDVVSHRYRVVRIAPTSVTVEDLPYHNTQSLPLVLN